MADVPPVVGIISSSEGRFPVGALNSIVSAFRSGRRSKEAEVRRSIELEICVSFEHWSADPRVDMSEIFGIGWQDVFTAEILSADGEDPWIFPQSDAGSTSPSIYGVVAPQVATDNTTPRQTRIFFRVIPGLDVLRETQIGPYERYLQNLVNRIRVKIQTRFGILVNVHYNLSVVHQGNAQAVS
jgi:hypothetical protein